MSLKITDLGGFKIGGVLNAETTEIYVHANISMWRGKQTPIKDTEGNITSIQVSTEALVTINDNPFEEGIQIPSISPLYQTVYTANQIDMNAKYLEVETSLMNQIYSNNPDWTIEIVDIETT